MGPELLLIFAILSAPVQTPPPPPPPPADSKWFRPTFSMRIENDSLRPRGDDDSYSQGMELRVGLDRETPIRWLPLNWVRWTPSKGEIFFQGTNLQIGQTLFTPHNIITYTPRADDRPFGAFLYAGLESIRWRRSTFRNNPKLNPADGNRVFKPRRLAVSLNVGITGKFAGGREAQSSFHVLRENRMSKGWLADQVPNRPLPFRPQINAQVVNEHVVLTTEEKFKDTKWGSFFDLTLMEEAVLGTTQTYAGAGATVRLGRGLSSLPSGGISYSAAPEGMKAFEMSVRAGGRMRGMLHNAFISGPLFTSTGLETKRGLAEWHVGVEARWHEWRISYVVVTRGNEIKNLAAGLPEKHKFAAINIARESEPWGDPKIGFRKIASGTRFNIRLGRARTSITPDGPVAHKPSLAASWGFEHSLPWNFSVAWEKTGATREGGPPVGGVHTDQFLLANAFTLGWETQLIKPAHKLQVRAGGGPALAKYQVTPDTGSLFEPERVNLIEKGKSVLGGLRYSWRVAAPVSLIVDVARARLTINKVLVTRANFTTFTFGVQLHPWRRDSGDID